MIVERESHHEFRTGAVAVGTSPVQLASDFTAAVGVELAADADNTKTVYIGHNGNVSAAVGYPLAAGEKLTIKVADPSKIWLVSSDDSQVVKWLIV